MTLRRWMMRNWFLLGLVGSVGAAWLWTDAGASGGALRSEKTVTLGIALIFFFQGLTLPIESLRRGLMRWRLHLLIQLLIFLLVPGLGVAFTWVFGRWTTPEIRLGFLYLAVLPTTISSAIVFTALADGNAAGALFNTTVANVLGIVVTPILIGWLGSAQGSALPLGSMIQGIAVLILVPLIAGQLVRPWVRRGADRHRHRFNTISSVIILFVIYVTFCNSLRSGVLTRSGASVTVDALLATGAFFLIVTTAVAAVIRLVRLERPDAIAALFCGSQKTLAAGVPMAKLIFAGNPGVGVILLPLVFYHPLQLLLGGFLVDWLRNHHEHSEQKG